MDTFNKIHRLQISWSTSKGRDTYGDKITRLHDSISGKRYRMYGGYDPVSTLLGDWFEDQYQAELVALVEKNADNLETYSTSCPDWQKVRGFYGLTYQHGKAMLDGGFGVKSMIHIIEACGFEIEKSYNKQNGALHAFYVQKKAG